MSSQNLNQKSINKSRLHVLGVDAEVDPVVGKKLRRGIYASDRIHSLVMGFRGLVKLVFFSL